MDLATVAQMCEEIARILDRNERPGWSALFRDMARELRKNPGREQLDWIYLAILGLMRGGSGSLTDPVFYREGKMLGDETSRYHLLLESIADTVHHELKIDRDSPNPSIAMASSAFPDVAGKLREFAGYLANERLTEAATAYQGYARELAAGVSSERLSEVAESVFKSLRAGPMTLADRPITNSDGSVNAEDTARFTALVEELRMFARRHRRRQSFFKS